MQFQAFPEKKKSPPTVKRPGRPNYPMKLDRLRSRELFNERSPARERNIVEEKGIRKYFFMGTMFLFNGNSIVFLLHFDNAGPEGMTVVIVMKSSSGKTVHK